MPSTGTLITRKLNRTMATWWPLACCLLATLVPKVWALALGSDTGSALAPLLPTNSTSLGALYVSVYASPLLSFNLDS